LLEGRSKLMPIIKRRRGISPVISTIILSAVVISIGGMVWSYAQGASSVVAMDYVDDTLDLLYEITERFSIEHVGNNSAGTILYVWISNYGDVDVILDVYADTSSSNSTNSSIEVLVGDIVLVELSFSGNPLARGDSLAIQAYSRRQNSEYSMHIVT